MEKKAFFFAGGGTGGHIYPCLAVAEKIAELDAEAKIDFFCSRREIDRQILKNTGFGYACLPARGFSIKPGRLVEFCKSFYDSYKIAKETIRKSESAVVIGAGGYVSGPVCLAAHKLEVPVKLLNVDIVPGRANMLLARWADKIFVQFEETAESFGRSKAAISVVGCPLRSGFDRPAAGKAIEQLGLDKDKKILLVTGASSGSASINAAICSLLERLSDFSDEWQVVHLAGRNDFEKVKERYGDAKIGHTVLRYFDDMADLLAAADLVVGRSGAVSVAEYAAAAVASICMPYPHHKDRHQYLNAGKLVEAGAAVIVDDLPDEEDRAEWLWEELEELMKDDGRRREMKANCEIVAKTDGALKIAERLLE